MLLQIQNLSFSYKRKNPIFSNFGLELHDGINVILGANGSGKTTLFKILATIIEPKAAEIKLNGTVHTASNYRNLISYIPQNFDVYPHIIVRHFLEFVGKVKYGYDKIKIKKKLNVCLNAQIFQIFWIKKSGSSLVECVSE